jgi:hypothetical protein
MTALGDKYLHRVVASVRTFSVHLVGHRGNKRRAGRVEIARRAASHASSFLQEGLRLCDTGGFNASIDLNQKEEWSIGHTRSRTKPWKKMEYLRSHGKCRNPGNQYQKENGSHISELR